MTGNYYKNLPIPSQQGLYDPNFEHASCGVGLVANINGLRSHSIIRQGMEVLINLGHRGATGADPETGDGAGILLQMPHQFLKLEAAKIGITLPPQGKYGVGATFLPQDSVQRQACENLIERVVLEEGQRFLGWRNVPISPDAIGNLANRVRPTIRQFFVGTADDMDPSYPFELKLYVIRKHIEHVVSETKLSSKNDFYISSLSSNKLVYKGLIMAQQLEGFYHDLNDETMVTSFALIHSRFSTNTLGSWKLAHPYRLMIHNGEINTLRGNINAMIAREAMLKSKVLGNDIEKISPVISPNQSDTATLDNVLELLLATGRSLEHSLMMLIPEAWSNEIPLDQPKKDFYQYHSALMEPWDGPALVVATDGTKVCAILDRNGLRPCRYLVTSNGLLVMASESGVLDIPTDQVLYKWRIQPGRMFMLDSRSGKIIDDDKIKSDLSSRKPYGTWIQDNMVTMAKLPEPDLIPKPNFETLLQQQIAFGYTQEDLKMLLEPMAVGGTEPVGSMGNDAPLAILSNENPLLFSYFKQLFAQVSNPPLDAIREELVTSVETFIGSEKNLFGETPEHCGQLNLKEPILTNRELAQIKTIEQPRLRSEILSTVFRPDKGSSALQQAMDMLCKKAVAAVQNGRTLLVLSDREADSKHAPIPSLLATAGVHHHLIREGLRTQTGLVVESGEPREVSHFALLFGYGAGAVNPYLAFDTLAGLVREGPLVHTLDIASAEKNFIKAIRKGVIKTMSKMGISTLQGYRGAQIFEAVGLSQEFVNRHFTWTTTRIDGIGITEIQEESQKRQQLAYPATPMTNSHQELPPGGQYQWREGSEYHMWNPNAIAKLQDAVRTNNPKSFEEFTAICNRESKSQYTIRGLLDFNKSGDPVPLDEVEPASAILTRFATGAVSFGSISREAHETMAIAMNRIGARSNTGEGGEDYNRYVPDLNGDSRSSAMKQVASGRFGVTINYLSNSTDIQIKMAQGSKPGEGGQLPGSKVDEYIAWVRNTTPGVELISPPPHHDIYSIEDLAQLIHDLKNSNPSARVHVKLVSEAGVGTIAAGVSKGRGDVVLISGDSGGTGASPESSIKHSGLPWELGLAETQQVLVMNDLRGRIVVQTDGQLKTGRDVAVACLLGAEEFGFATAPIVSMGCIMLRKCHFGTCSVGIATQDPELRKSFSGQPEHIINYFRFVAEDFRHYMSALGFRTVNEMVGRVDKLHTKNASDHWKARGIDLMPLLHMPDVPKDVARFHCEDQDHVLEKALDKQLINQCQDAIESGTRVSISMPISNSNRAVGTSLSYEIAKRFGEEGLPDGTIDLAFTGSAGQSFAAFLAKGINIRLEGDVNDYLCKGLSGGNVIVVPHRQSVFPPEENILVGNVCLYGATSGKVLIRGIAGERFAVRNSGADAVVEGVGDHACEYMTRGRIVVLGPTGRNFAAGMSGGEAYVLDEHGLFAGLCNTEMVDLQAVETDEDANILRCLLTEHYRGTGSSNAERILNQWDKMLVNFVKVMPRNHKRALAELSSVRGISHG
ncbi:MAG: glutamate synthase large subunit [SAR202 cluster bacterium]|nr:glutamate synthase large subunit [SAR202 cluster bacterium]